MPAIDSDTVDRIRDASRRLVRELGFMQATLAGTDMSPSAVHAIIEIGAGRAESARDLVQILRLEKSTVSRLLKSLIAKGYLRERPDRSDTRLKRLELTGSGQNCLAGISAFACRQVEAAIAPLDAKAASSLADALDLYAKALATASGREA